MNDHPLDNPRLRSLEAQLAQLAPQASPAEQQQLLYQCAFAAGRQAARKTIRRWQAATAVVAVLFGLSMPLGRDNSLLARRAAEPPAPKGLAPRQIPAEQEAPLIVQRQPAAVALDAWQSRPSTDTFANELAQFEYSDVRARSLSLGRLTREILKP
jgi:hypothetical protein